MAASESVRTLQNLNRSCILHSLCSRDVRCFPGNAKAFEGRHRHKSSITMIRSHPLLSRSSSAQYCFGVRQQAHSRLVSSAITDRQRRRRRLSVTIRKQQCAAYTVEIEHAGGTTALDVEEGDTILETALEAGLELSHDCKMGVCMTCPAKLVEGKIDQSAGMLDEKVIEKGYALLCVSEPRSDCKIRVIDEDEILGEVLCSSGTAG